MVEPVRTFIRNGKSSYPWEETVETIGKAAIKLRVDVLKIPISEGTKLLEHSEYIHNLGRHVLQVQLNEKEIDNDSSKQKNRLKPKRVRVDDDDDIDIDYNNDNAKVLNLDQEWDITTWNDDMVLSSCETIFLKFQEPTFLLDEFKKAKAVAMFEKLFNNHKIGETFMKKNIEFMVSNSTSRLLRDGRSCSSFNYLYIINIFKEKCTTELSYFRFAFKAIEMMLIECRLAATLIQHTYRSSKLKHQIKSLYNSKTTVVAINGKKKENKEKNGISYDKKNEFEKNYDNDDDYNYKNNSNSKSNTENTNNETSDDYNDDNKDSNSINNNNYKNNNENSNANNNKDRNNDNQNKLKNIKESTVFGSDIEMKKLKERPINARSLYLRNRWNLIHWNELIVFDPVNSRGPVHIGRIYTKLLLEILAYILSDNGGEHVNSSRIDVIDAYGCIILPILFSNFYGDFSVYVISILASISRIGESMLVLLNFNVIEQCLKYMRYLKKFHRNLIKIDNGQKINNHNKYNSKNNNEKRENGNNEFDPSISDDRSYGLGVSVHNDAEALDDDSLMSENTENWMKKIESIKSKKLEILRKEEKINKIAESGRNSYMNCLEVVLHLSEHASGIFICREQQENTNISQNLKSKKNSIDYNLLLKKISKEKSGPKNDLDMSETILHYMANKEMIREIVFVIDNTINISLLKISLKTLFTLACCECHNTVVEGILADGGRGVRRLIELLEEDDSWISGYAMYILLQINSIEYGRKSLLNKTFDIAQLLSYLLYGSNKSKGYHKAVLVAASICRQQNLFSYSPFILPLLSGRKDLKLYILTDCVRSMKNPSNVINMDMTLADLIIMPLDRLCAEEFSMAVDNVGAKAMGDFIYR